MLDIAKGLRYIHRIDEIGVHGNLRAANCLIDQQRTCRLTDFGLSLLLENQKEMPNQDSMESLLSTFSNDQKYSAASGIRAKFSVKRISRRNNKDESPNVPSLTPDMNQKGSENEKRLSHNCTISPFKPPLQNIIYYYPKRMEAFRRTLEKAEDDDRTNTSNANFDKTMNHPSVIQSTEDDLYACGLIFFEILSEQSLFECVNRSVVSVQKSLLVKGKLVTDIINLDVLSDNVDQQELISRLVGLSKTTKPCTAKEVIKSLSSIYPEIAKSSLADVMVKKLQAYSENLEEIVEDRTNELMLEKEKITGLLYEMVPQVIAEEMLSNRTNDSDTYIQPKYYDCVSVFFNDIVGFTTLCSKTPANDIINMLNNLFMTFDSLTNLRNITKITTIGDAYMAASGISVPNKNLHARDICLFALDMCKALEVFEVPFNDNISLQMRSGINSGPVMAGILVNIISMKPRNVQ